MAQLFPKEADVSNNLQAYQNINAPTYFEGAFTSRLVDDPDLNRLAAILEEANQPENPRHLLSRFELSGEAITLTKIEHAVEHDIRINGRQFFYHRGKLRPPSEGVSTLEYLQYIEECAHIASVGEVLLLACANLLWLPRQGVYAPIPSLTGSSPTTNQRTWFLLQPGASRRINSVLNLQVAVVDSPDLAAGQFTLFVRAQKVPMGVEAQQVYRHDGSKTKTPDEGHTT